MRESRTREQQVLVELREGPCTAAEVAAILEWPVTTVSAHLAGLERRGVVVKVGSVPNGNGKQGRQSSFIYALKGMSHMADEIQPLSIALSPHELAVLEMVARGKTAREIATETGRAVKTIDTQRTMVLRKLGARSSAEAVSIAIGRGLIQPSTAVAAGGRA